MINLDSRKLKNINKPARYVGGEVNVVMKSSNVRKSIVLCYPNLYEKAMSKNIVSLLYNNINLINDVWCKRCFAPDLDFERMLKENNLQLYSLEDYKSIKENDILLFVIDDEQNFTNVINMLFLSDISIYKENRDNKTPQIWLLPLNNINILPIKKIADKIFDVKDEKENVQEILKELELNQNVRVQNITSGIVPSIKINNSSIIIDFNYMLDSDEIIKYIENSISERGINKVSFLNYNKIDQYKFCEIVYRIKMNIPDIRIIAKNIDFNDFVPDLLDVLLPCMEPSSMYFNVITVSDKLKQKTNIGTDRTVLCNRLVKAFKNNRNSITLDFNIGLPEETYEDIDDIFEFLQEIIDMYSRNRAKDKFSMKVNIHYYIPENNSSVTNVNKLETKLRYIKEKKYDSIIKLDIDKMEEYNIKILLKNGDETILKVMEDAYRLGARFDKDYKKYNKEAWEKAMYDNITLVNTCMNR